MSALEQEVIEKFNQLDREAKERVSKLIILTAENETSHRLGEFLAFTKQVATQSRAEKRPTTPTLQEMLDEIRGNDE